MSKFPLDIYTRLIQLKQIVTDKTNAPGLRRLAMHEFNRLFNSHKK